MSEIADLYYSRDGDQYEESTTTRWPSRDHDPSRRAAEADAEEADDE